MCSETIGKMEIEINDVISNERKALDIKNGDKTLGIALSGGGIRSASFGFGVLQALNEHGVLEKADYLSTVSGGGYIGSAFTWYRKLSLNCKKFSFFKNEKEGFISFLRHHGRYLTPSSRLKIISVLAVLIRSLLVSAVIYFSILFVTISVLGLLGQHSAFDDSYNWIKNKAVNNIEDESKAATNTKTNIALKNLYDSEKAGTNKIDVVDNVEIEAGVLAKANNTNKSTWEQRGFFRLAVDLAALSLLLFVFWTLVISLSKLISKRSRREFYLFRIFSQQFQGILLKAFLVFVVFATIPFVQEYLEIYLKDRFEAVGILGIISGVWAALARLRKHMGKVDVFIKKPWIGNLLFRCGAVLFIYAMLIMAYHWSLKLGMQALVGDDISWASLINSKILISLLIILFGWILLNINDSTVASMYRDRLMEVFLPNHDAVKDNKWMEATYANNLGLEKMCKHPVDKTKCVKPYHLINTNIILFGSKDVKLNNRRGDSFILSPLYCGSCATKYISTDDFNPSGGITLATAMATSGAAVNPHTGVAGVGPTCDWFVSFMMSFFNLRLGFWFINPKNPKPWLKPNYIFPGLYSLLGCGHKESDSYIELSDGGHFENLGIYELVRRRVHTIIISDASADKHFCFGDLANAIERVRADFGVEIRFEPEEEEFGSLLPCSYNLPPNAHAGQTLFAEKFKIAKKGYATGKIKYPRVIIEKNGCKETLEKFDGDIYLIKSTLLSDLPVDLYGYRARNADFPDQTTGDQFFDENQFEAYRELGYRAAIPVAESLSLFERIGESAKILRENTAGVEKRKDPRRTTFIDISYSPDQRRVFEDFVRNISAGGIYIETKLVLEPGQKLTMTFPHPDSSDPIKVLGKIVRIDSRGIGVKFDL